MLSHYLLLHLLPCGSAVQHNHYICYDYLQVAGGAERVGLILANHFDCPLIVSRSYPAAQPLQQHYRARIIYLGNKVTRAFGRVLESIWCHRQRTSFLRDASWVLYTGLYAPFAVRHQKTGKKYYYCHTLPRFAYDRKEEYRARIPLLLRWLFDILVSFIRYEYERSLVQMDGIIVNSKTVQQRLKQQANIESHVVYPPVETSRFSWLADDGYFISLARLTPNKRVDKIIEAFLKMPHQKLVIASGGAELEHLQALASNAPNIRFVGLQSDTELAQLIGRARAAIYIARDEDFGMSPVEAMAAGKPVIGVAEGGLKETIIDGQTGILLPTDAAIDALITAIQTMDAEKAASMRTCCEEHAAKFDTSHFASSMRNILDWGNQWLG